MTLFLIGKDLVLEGSRLKIEDKQVPGIYIYIPRKSKPTKLCHLVGSGILCMNHPKHQPLCLVGWTSRVLHI